MTHHFPGFENTLVGMTMDDFALADDFANGNSSNLVSFGSLLVDINSPTPYTDATQVSISAYNTYITLVKADLMLSTHWQEIHSVL